MTGTNDPEQKPTETEIGFPSIIIVLFPIIFILMAILILTMLPWLIGAYNYLRGMPSPISLCNNQIRCLEERERGQTQ